MKKLCFSVCAALTLLLGVRAAAFAQELTVGGQAVGIELSTQGVVVEGMADIDTAEGTRSPAREAGFQKGDVIVQIDEQAVSSASEFLSAVGALEGKEAMVTVLRGGEESCLRVAPVLSRQQQWMLGLWLRDRISGIGTLTFSDPLNGTYGALGHAVSDAETGATLPLGSGNITDAQVVAIVPGEEGKPGELSGCADSAHPLGTVSQNTDRGIYGVLTQALEGRRMETGEMHPGSATILSTVHGREVGEYQVQIDRVYQEDGCTRALLTVTDPVLCGLTGGIVQGMSGSPIVQNGRLVGAITHVFVDNPRKGFGISIQDMLDIAEKAA